MSKNPKSILKENKISRKKFFLFAGAAVSIAAAVTKYPFKLLAGKSEAIADSTGKIKVKENPFSVKRNII